MRWLLAPLVSVVSWQQFACSSCELSESFVRLEVGNFFDVLRSQLDSQALNRKRSQPDWITSPKERKQRTNTVHLMQCYLVHNSKFWYVHGFVTNGAIQWMGRCKCNPPHHAISDLIFTHLWSIRVWNSVQASDITTDNTRARTKLFLTNSCTEF